jgi:hypothetical protein
MKKLILIGLIGFCIYSGLAFQTQQNENPKSIYGIWVEKKSAGDTSKVTQLSFYPGGKINILRGLYSYTGYFKVHEQRSNYIAGYLIIGEHFNFNAIFIKPDEIKLTINYRGRSEIRYMKKVKEVKSGFQLIEKDKS